MVQQQPAERCRRRGAGEIAAGCRSYGEKEAGGLQEPGRQLGESVCVGQLLDTRRRRRMTACTRAR
ncbi:hypothetical protein, partial [Streptomyces lavendulae]|uniref:hypothetical protein n=1 Tax=Streptomyces lavendulae TaxID=1914 RepID=UPI0031EF7CEB